MKALSVRAPWWWAILHGKDIENRDWPTNFRGVILLHASKWWNIGDISEDWEDVKDMGARANCALPLPVGNQAARDLCVEMRAAGGCIVGSVEIVDCVQRSNSPWFVGRYGFVLRRPIIYRKPIPFKGGFFEVPDEILCGEQ